MLSDHSNHLESMFPPGTPVCVQQTIEQLEGSPIQNEVIGLVVKWEQKPTGSWFAQGKDDKLWLTRLRLIKLDDELTLLVIDPSTRVAKIEAAAAS